MAKKRASRTNPKTATILGEFKDEKDFRENWIHPFLSRLGYVLPVNSHGRNEFGKDFYFADHDRFGNIRFMSAQAKLGRQGTKETEVLLRQIKQSFAVPIPYNGTEQRVSAVYVMSPDVISDNAKAYIYREIGHSYGENVYFLDGQTLKNIESHATHVEDSELRKVLTACAKECMENSFRLTPTVTMHLAYFALADAMRQGLLPSKHWTLWNMIKMYNDLVSPPADRVALEEMKPGLREELVIYANGINDSLAELDRKYKITINLPAE